jgi:hypothetical protein
VAEPDEERRERAPDDAVGVDGAQATEGEPGAVAEEAGVGELQRDERTDGGEDQQPGQAPAQPGTDESGIDERVVARGGEAARNLLGRNL